MCGIIGISDGDSTQVYAGLYALQHRGQDSCGILTYDKEEFYLKKAPGLVTEAFTENSLRELKGNMGIGQVRYPTVGGDFSRDAQPFFSTSPVSIGIAHNGNIANYAKIRKKVGKLTSWCDVEVILNILANELSAEKDIFAAVASVMSQVNGAYSVVSIVDKVGMVVFRDPFAIRPLVEGEGVFASESVALDIIGKKLEGDVKPGECIVINDGSVERRRLVKEKPRHCMFEYVYFSRPDSIVEGKSVYEVRVNMGRELAKKWDKDADVVVPVPDTARAAAFGFSEETGIPYREGLIKNRYVGRTFIMPSQSSRENAVRIKLNPIKNVLKGKKVVLVEDSVVRGTTSKNLIDLVRSAGAKEVHFAVSCPPIRWPCFYGIDMTRKGELFAANVEDAEKELAKKIGADSVIYQTLDGLKKAIGIPNLCTACIDGNYPTDVSFLLNNHKEGKRPYEED
ncbi:MAG: amidophosphoribosyltransferase [Candidatus Diapherotrites archaeon]|nr:amidophosphoribosyltransferase [Candidatus Diapherotrites archaeon]